MECPRAGYHKVSVALFECSSSSYSLVFPNTLTIKVVLSTYVRMLSYLDISFVKHLTPLTLNSTSLQLFITEQNEMRFLDKIA